MDIIRDGFDLASRIGELEDSPLVARKLSPDTRVMVPAPSYLQRNCTPKSLNDLVNHNCLSAGAQDIRSIEGPGGQQEVRVKGNIRSNSADMIRKALIAGLGIGLRCSWEVGQEIKNGQLEVVLPQYRGSSNMAIYAVYTSHDFMPAKVDVLLDSLGQHFGPDPYWDKSLNLEAARSTGSARGGKPSSQRTNGKRLSTNML